MGIVKFVFTVISNEVRDNFFELSMSKKILNKFKFAGVVFVGLDMLTESRLGTAGATSSCHKSKSTEKLPSTDLRDFNCSF